MMWCTILSWIVQLLTLVSSCRIRQLLLVQLHSVDSMNCNDEVTQTNAQSASLKTIQGKDDMHDQNNRQKLPIKTSYYHHYLH